MVRFYVDTPVKRFKKVFAWIGTVWGYRGCGIIETKKGLISPVNMSSSFPKFHVVFAGRHLGWWQCEHYGKVPGKGVEF